MTAEPYYDPEIKAVIEAGPRLGTVNERTLPKVRADRSMLNEQVPLSDEVERTDHVVPGPEGAPDIRLRVHRPRRADGPLPCLYWIHGGGYVLGVARAGRPAVRPLVPAVRPRRRGGAVPPGARAPVPGPRGGLLRRR